MGVEKYDILKTLYRKQSFPEYYLTLYDFADSLDANELYNTDRPTHVPPGSRFREHVTVMKDLGVGADRGDSLLKEKRKEVRDLSELDMHSSVSYMQTIAIYRQDPTLLHGLSLPLKDDQPKSSRRGASFPRVREIQVEVTRLEGERGGIVIKGRHFRNGGPYLINLCKGKPISEESWYNPGGHYNSCRKIVLRNLESVNEYFVRMRTDGPDGPGDWSRPVSIIVL